MKFLYKKNTRTIYKGIYVETVFRKNYKFPKFIRVEIACNSSPRRRLEDF